MSAYYIFYFYSCYVVIRNRNGTTHCIVILRVALLCNTRNLLLLSLMKHGVFHSSVALSFVTSTNRRFAVLCSTFDLRNKCVEKFVFLNKGFLTIPNCVKKRWLQR